MEKLIEIILNYVEPDDEITADTKIKSDLGMSSFDLACLANDIRDEFSVTLNADDFRNYPTIGALAQHLESKAE